MEKKIKILEENNKLLIQQKYQMYEDLDIAYKRIDKAIEYVQEDLDELDFDNYSLYGYEWFTKLLQILKGEDK